jgi:16S rRNA (cytosine1402-N4)-methyltransferase
VIGIDRDPEAVRHASGRLAGYGEQFEPRRGRFSDMETAAGDRAGAIDGVLLDLGISSRMVDDPSRGFSYREEGPLLMTMESEGMTAKDIVNNAPEEELIRIFREYGEERRAKAVARAVVRARHSSPVSTTRQLAEIVRAAAGGPTPQKSQARVFQALRIVVNDELGELEQGLQAAVRVLAPAGRLCVISYHSLEDREVKNFMRTAERPCICPPELPVCRCGKVPMLHVVTRRPVTPSAEEIADNPRARSARLRAAERLAA